MTAELLWHSIYTWSMTSRPRGLQDVESHWPWIPIWTWESDIILSLAQLLAPSRKGVCVGLPWTGLCHLFCEWCHQSSSLSIWGSSEERDYEDSSKNRNIPGLLWVGLDFPGLLLHLQILTLLTNIQTYFSVELMLYGLEWRDDGFKFLFNLRLGGGGVAQWQRTCHWDSIPRTAKEKRRC